MHFMSYLPNSSKCLGRLIGANMNTTADQPISICASKYIVRRIIAVNPSTSLTVALGGVYTGANKSGTAVVAGTQAYTGLTGSSKFTDATLASGVVGDVLTVPELYFSLTTAQGGAATADIFIFGDDLS